MALDPSIPLQLKQVEMPDWMSLAQKHQSILNARAQEQNALLEAEQRRTQMPGIAAEAEGKVRTNRLSQIQEEEARNPANLNPDGTVNEAAYAQSVFKRGAASASQDAQAKTAANRAAVAQAKTAEFKAEIDAKAPAFQEWLAGNKDKYMVQDPKNPGKVVLDLPSLQAAGTSAGFPIHAMEFAKLHLDQLQSEAKASTSQSEAVIKSVEVNATARKILADINENIKDPVVRNKAIEGFVKMHPNLAFLVGTPDKNGDYPAMNRDEIRAAKAAVQTPEQQAQTAEIHENALAQRAAAYAGVAEIDQRVAAFKNGTLSPLERTKLGIEGETHYADSGTLADGIRALEKWTATGSTVLNQPVQIVAGKIEDNTEQAAYQAAKAVYEARTGKPLPPGTTAREALAMLKNEQQKANGLANTIDKAIANPGKAPTAREPNKVTVPPHPPAPQRLTSRAEFDALKPGAKFLDENGNVRTKK